MTEKGRPETILEFSTSTLEPMKGFTLDFGGSVVKIAYLSKEDWKDRKPDSKDPGKVRLISFAREEFDEGLEFLKKNCYIRRTSDDDRPLMFTCGLGGVQYGKKIEDELNIRTQVLSEMNCFQASLDFFVENWALDDFCEPVSKEATAKGVHAANVLVHLMKGLTEKGLGKAQFMDNALEMLEEKHDPRANIRPYLMASFGSAWAVVKFTETGMHQMVHVCGFAGRSFLGLGSLLTGAKTYGELMELAEKGNNLNVDMTNEDATASKASESKHGQSLYSAIHDMDPRPVFLWGQAVGKNLSDFKKEDVARTLLYTMCQELVSTALYACHATRIKHIFIGGSFIAHALTQRLVMEEFEYWKLIKATTGNVEGDYHLHILRHGSHLGALGAFLDHDSQH